MRIVLLAAALTAGCGHFGFRAGPTSGGEVVASQAAGRGSARDEALMSRIELFAAPGTAAYDEARHYVLQREGEFIGREKAKKKVTLVEVRLDKLAAALDKEGIGRPSGYSAGPPRVLVAVSEPMDAMGVGRAGDALRRGLLARGVQAADAREGLPRGKVPTEPKELAAASARAGYDWLVIGLAQAITSPDPDTGASKAQAALQAELIDARKGSSVGAVDSGSSSLDVSTGAAAAKALDQAGEVAAGNAKRALAQATGGRRTASVLAGGDVSAERLKELVSALRRVEGVEGAGLASVGDGDGAVLRVFLRGIGVDELAARLLRQMPTVTLFSVDTEVGRLAIELPPRGGEVQ